MADGIYLEPEELNAAYYEADRVAVDWMRPFNEYERIAGNKLSKNLAPNMPKVNDGSLAASLLETPMQVLPNMQPGKFTSTSKHKWVNEIANIIWKTKILPNANTQASFFDKEQIALYRAIKYGAQPRYNFFVSTENYTGSDWSLPYIRNVKLEPGKFSVDDCDYVFLDIYYTKIQLKKIIKQQKEEIKLAKKENREPDTSWDVANLKALADKSMTSKEYEEQNINERDKQISSSGIKTTAIFHRGKNAPFYMFSPHLEGGKTLRKWDNPDPTGDIPITFQYCYETLESPYAIGRVELAGPTQNVLDYMTQAHVLATQLGLQPPKKISGPIDTLDLDSIVNTPDAIWILGQAQVDVVQPTNSVYTQFPANYGLYKAQLQNLQGRTDGSVSAESGNPEFSKTPAGIKQQESRTNAQDNYLRNKADIASAKMAEKMMNIHMSKMEGADILEIAEEDRDRLVLAGFFDEDPDTDIPSITEIEIMYDDLKETFKFEYDPRPETDEEEKARMLEVLDIATSSPEVIPAIEQAGYKLNLGEVFKSIIGSTGIVDVEKIISKIDNQEGGVGEDGQPQEQIDPNTGLPVGIDPETGQPVDQLLDRDVALKEQKILQSDEIHKEKLKQLKGKHKMPDGSTMPGKNHEEYQKAVGGGQPQDELQATMDKYGVDENVAATIIEGVKQGYSEEDIVNFLRGGGQNA